MIEKTKEIDIRSNIHEPMSTIRVDKKKADFVFLKAQKSRFHLFFKGTKKQIFNIFLKA